MANTFKHNLSVVSVLFHVEHSNEHGEFIRRNIASYIDLLDYCSELRDLDIPFDITLYTYYENGNVNINPFKLF